MSKVSVCDKPATEVSLVTPVTSVTILGKSMTGRTCPFDTDEVWGVNNVAEQPEYAGKKFHKLFAFDLLPPEYTNGIKKFGPVCSWQDYADLKYPIEDVIKTFSTKYFTNTVSYMIAYAAYLKIPRIYIYGVDVTFGAPYAQENRGVEYWIGRAQERGCEVMVHESSHLLRTVSGAMYGERDHCNAMLYLNERIALINLLPGKGHYPDALKAQNAWWVLMPKSDEAAAHEIKVIQNPNGAQTFQSREEFLSDIHMPPETWDYIRSMLKGMEASGELPFAAISVYEKLILSTPDGGN